MLLMHVVTVPRAQVPHDVLVHLALSDEVEPKPLRAQVDDERLPESMQDAAVEPFEAPTLRLVLRVAHHARRDEPLVQQHRAYCVVVPQRQRQHGDVPRHAREHGEVVPTRERVAYGLSRPRLRVADEGEEEAEAQRACEGRAGGQGCVVVQAGEAGGEPDA